MINHHHTENYSKHHQNIRASAIEIYKFIQGISPPFLNEAFVPRQCNYDLRGNKFLESKRKKSVRCGTESLNLYHS